MTDVYKALSSPVRRDILALLQQEDMTAGEIADTLASAGTVISKPTLSGHFNILKTADLVVMEKQGTTITYSINTSVMEDLMRQMMGLFGRSESDSPNDQDPNNHDPSDDSEDNNKNNKNNDKKGDHPC